MSTASPPSVDAGWLDLLGGVIHAGRRVVSAHARHFLALAVIFLLPFSVLLLSAPSPFSAPVRPLAVTAADDSPSFDPPFLLAAAVVGLAVLLALSAAAAVAHSVRQGFYGRQVKLVETLLAVPAGIARLTVTLLAAAVPATLVVVLVFMSFRLIALIRPPGLPDSGAVYLQTPVVGIAIGALLAMLLNWSLAAPAAVIESRLGFIPLLRSSELISGMRWAAFSLSAFFSVAVGLVMWLFSLETVQVRAGDWTAVIPGVTKMVIGSAAIAALLLYGLVTNVVLFMYCKALHGELVKEIIDEYADEYLYLPFDDRKEPRVIVVVQ